MYINLKEEISMRKIDYVTNKRTSKYVSIFDGYLIRISLLNTYLNLLKNTPTPKKQESKFLSECVVGNDRNIVAGLGLEDTQTFSWNAITTNLTPNLEALIPQGQRNDAILHWLRTKCTTNTLSSIYNIGDKGDDFLTKKNGVNHSFKELTNLNVDGYKVFLQFMENITELAEYRSNSKDIGKYNELSNGEPEYYILGLLLAVDSYNIGRQLGYKTNKDMPPYNLHLYEEMQALGYGTAEGVINRYEQYNQVVTNSLKVGDGYLKNPFTSQADNTGNTYFESVPLGIGKDKSVLYNLLSERSRLYFTTIRSAFWKLFGEINYTNVERYAREPYLLFREVLYLLNTRYDFLPSDDDNVIHLKTSEEFIKVLLGDYDMENNRYLDTYTIIQEKPTKQVITKHPLSYYIPPYLYNRQYWEHTNSFTSWLNEVDKIHKANIQHNIKNYFTNGSVESSHNLLNFNLEDIQQSLSIDDKLDLCMEILVECQQTLVSTVIPSNTLSITEKFRKPFLDKFFHLITEVYSLQPQPIRAEASNDYTEDLNKLREVYQEIFIKPNTLHTNPNDSYNSFRCMNGLRNSHEESVKRSVLGSAYPYGDLDGIEFVLTEVFKLEDTVLSMLSTSSKPNPIIVKHLLALSNRYKNIFPEGNNLNVVGLLNIPTTYTRYNGLPLYQCLGEVYQFPLHIRNTTVINSNGKNLYAEVIVSMPIGDYLVIYYKAGSYRGIKYTPLSQVEFYTDSETDLIIGMGVKL